MQDKGTVLQVAVFSGESDIGLALQTPRVTRTTLYS